MQTPLRLIKRCGLAAAAAPGAALAHGSDHLHFWGRHTAEAQGLLLGGALLALAGLGWWLWRSRG